MSYLDNSDKYYHYNCPSLLLDKLFLEDYEKIEINDTNDILLNFEHPTFFFNQENDETNSFFQPKLTEEKIYPNNNSSESYRNASTVTKSIKESIFKISKNPKNPDNKDTSSNASNASNPNNEKNVNNTINTNIGKKRKRAKNFKNGNHNKFCYDNMTRKLKSKFFPLILNILNSSLKAEPIKSDHLFSKKKRNI